MATVYRYSAYDRIIGHIWRVRDRSRSLYIAEGLLLVVSSALSLVLIFALVDGFIHLPRPFRLAAFFIILSILLFGSIFFIFRRILAQPSDEAVARHIEDNFPHLNNSLINAVQLAKDSRSPSAALVNEALRETLTSCERLNLLEAVEAQRLRKLFIAFVIIALLLTSYGLLMPLRFRGALRRLANPFTFVPATGSVVIAEVLPGDCSLTAGSDLSVLAKIAQPAGGNLPGRAGRACFFYALEGAPEISQEMTPRDERTFTFLLPDVRVSLKYRVEIGGTQSEIFSARVVEKPQVASLTLKYEYPKYTGLPVKIVQDEGNISAPQGTTVRLTARMNKEVASGFLLLASHEKSPLILSTDKLTFSGSIWVAKDGFYEIYASDPAGNSSPSPVRYAIQAIKDKVPWVRVGSPGEDITLAPGDRLTIAIEAGDDYGLKEVALFAKKDETARETQIYRWEEFPKVKTAVVAYDWFFAPDLYKSGDVVSYWAVATDNNGFSGPETSTSARFLIRLVDKEAETRRKLEELSQWQERLQEVLKMQKEARATAGILGDLKEIGLVKSSVGKIGLKQAKIRQGTKACAEEMDPLDENLRRIREVLYGLTANEMVDALKAVQALTRSENIEQLPTMVLLLTTPQDRIIYYLEKILDILPKIAEAITTSTTEEGYDLPAETKEKLRQLAEKLAQFTEEQKKVIEETYDLTKTPVDDFTEEDLKILNELAATEADWAKFLKETYTDLSKVPEQDFSNPTLLKELNEIYSEVEMAEDALTRKVIEMAVPHEQAGLELAEELTTHIEKWLPDVADRLRWEMEEPLQDYEVPMAELPEELEDIIGDLLEGEEDLFEDIEDASSGWADSLDKGAGWTAMDGPISNMSAQGVTGNVLPNTSEIGGRSGEGRTGKAHGEMVEESATGKGGRRTPTRLTPDAFEAEVVDDKSTEPMGGATGGGKIAGAGGEGLEGPIPPEVSAKFGRLAHRQADLRNKAERIQLGFKVMNYPNEEMARSIEIMEEVEGDLGNARYQNVLRKKDVLLKSLENSRMFLRGEMALNRDRSLGLPKYLQDEILDAMGRGGPAGYEELLRQYYEALSTSR